MSVVDFASESAVHIAVCVKAVAPAPTADASNVIEVASAVCSIL